MFEWLRKHKIWVAIISLLIILGVPLLIHILYKIKAPNAFFVAEWSAGELLSYYGSILAFLGTVVLGVLALYQNHIIKCQKRTLKKWKSMKFKEFRMILLKKFSEL